MNVGMALFISVIVVVVVAFIAAGVFFTRFFILKKKYKNSLEEQNQDDKLENEVAVNMESLGDVVEIPEIIISIIKTISINNFKRILFVGKVSELECLPIVNSSKSLFYIDENKNKQLFPLLKNKAIHNNLNIANLNEKYDLIVELESSENTYENFDNNFDHIEQNGMMIINKINLIKGLKKILIKKIKQNNYNYENINFNNGVIYVVRPQGDREYEK